MHLLDDPGRRWTAAMRRGDFAAAHAVSDGVLAARDPGDRDNPGLPYHRRWVWDGRPFDGRQVLVRCYHGLGDTLQFVRFLPALRRRAAHVALEVQAELAPLLATVPGADRVIPFQVATPSPPAEVDIESMELAHALRVNADQLGPVPYLTTAPATLGGGVGLCWRAGGWDPDRSVPLPLILPLLAGCRLVSLQPGPEQPPAAVNPDGPPAGLTDLAALIAGLDHVVTVDSMVAHLAGALGRPASVLLKYDADWRWMVGRAQSPWYPTLRLYRQPAPGDWPSALAALARDLALSADRRTAPAHAAARRRPQPSVPPGSGTRSRPR